MRIILCSGSSISQGDQALPYFSHLQIPQLRLRFSSLNFGLIPTFLFLQAGYTEFKDVPVAQIKKITAQRLLESKQTIPHYYLTIDCKVDKLIALRAQLNEALAASKNGGKLSVNDFVIKAAAQV